MEGYARAFADAERMRAARLPILSHQALAFSGRASGSTTPISRWAVTCTPRSSEIPGLRSAVSTRTELARRIQCAPKA